MNNTTMLSSKYNKKTPSYSEQPPKPQSILSSIFPIRRPTELSKDNLTMTHKNEPNPSLFTIHSSTYSFIK